MMLIMIMMRMGRGGTAETVVTGAPRVTCQRVMSGRYSMKLCVGLHADKGREERRRHGLRRLARTLAAIIHLLASIEWQLVADKTTTTRCTGGRCHYTHGVPQRHALQSQHSTLSPTSSCSSSTLYLMD